MPETLTWYGNSMLHALEKRVDINSDDIRLMVVGTGYTFNKDTHLWKSDIAGEVVGTGYTAGGKTMTTVSLVYDAANDRVVVDADDVFWDNSTLNAGANIPRGAIAYDFTSGGADTARPLLFYVDFQGDRATNNGRLEVRFNVAGIGRITVP